MSSREDRRRQAMDQVMDVFGRLRVLVDTGTERRGLTHARAGVLMALHREGSLTGVDLAKRFDVTPRNVTALVDALEAQGLVTRSAAPRRPEGPARRPHPRRPVMATGMQRGYERMTETMLADFSGPELAELERVVGRLAEALDGYQLRSGRAQHLGRHLQVGDEPRELRLLRRRVLRPQDRRRVHGGHDRRLQVPVDESAALLRDPERRPSRACAAVAPRHTTSRGRTSSISASSQGRQAAISSAFGRWWSRRLPAAST